MIKGCSEYHLKSSEIQEVQFWSLEENFGRLADLAPASFRVWHLWSLKHNLKKMAIVVLHHSEFYNKSPWENISEFTELVPTVFTFTKLVLVNNTKPKHITHKPDPLFSSSNTNNPPSIFNIPQAQHHLPDPKY